MAVGRAAGAGDGVSLGVTSRGPTADWDGGEPGKHPCFTAAPLRCPCISGTQSQGWDGSESRSRSREAAQPFPAGSSSGAAGCGPCIVLPPCQAQPGWVPEEKGPSLPTTLDPRSLPAPGSSQRWQGQHPPARDTVVTGWELLPSWVQASHCCQCCSHWDGRVSPVPPPAHSPPAPRPHGMGRMWAPVAQPWGSVLAPAEWGAEGAARTRPIPASSSPPG